MGLSILNIVTAQTRGGWCLGEGGASERTDISLFRGKVQKEGRKKRRRRRKNCIFIVELKESYFIHLPEAAVAKTTTNLTRTPKQSTQKHADASKITLIISRGKDMSCEFGETII